MMTTAAGQKLCRELAQALQEFWEDYTGVRPVHTRVVVDGRTIAICLEQVLTPAEREMASTRDGREMLKELEEQILEQAMLSDLKDTSQARASRLAVVVASLLGGLSRLVDGVLILVPLFFDHIFPASIYAYVSSLGLALVTVVGLEASTAAS